ncbi:MAG TPA: hypothetical protein VEK56_04505 [Vicinamibacterales bacterium]|nr:hypothetical protein [Vicinamibacterales bacterium]
MSGKRVRRLVLAVWAALAFVIWNVVYDREVSLAGAEFTRTQVQRYQRGEPVASINAAFRPRVAHAAQIASIWGGGVLTTGIVLSKIAERQSRRA